MQTLKHTWKTPLICTKCQSKLHFNKKEWYKIVTPLIFLGILVIVTDIFFTPNILVYFAFIVLIVAECIYSLIRLNSIKLDMKK